MKDVLKNKKYLFLFILLAVVTVTTVSKLSKSKLLNGLKKTVNDYNEVQENDKKIPGTDFVTFDAFFLKDTNNDGKAEGYRGSKINYGYSDKLYIELNISGDVKVKNGKIKFVNDNVKVSGVLSKSSIIPKNITSDDYKTIELNSEIGNGTSSFFYLNVSPYIENDLNKFNGINKVIFEATIVDSVTGEETPVSKEIEYNVDSECNTIHTKISSTSSEDVTNKGIVTYTIEVQEDYNLMPMSASYLEGSISDFDNLHPSSVEVRSADGAAIEFNYDSDTQTFQAVKKAILTDKKITRNAYNLKNNNVRYNKWFVTVKYPVTEDMELMNKQASISVKAYNKGYSNIDLDEIKSNEVTKIISHMFTILPEVDHLDFWDSSKIYHGKYAETIRNYFVDKTHLENVYLGLETSNFDFTETWDISTKTDVATGLKYEEMGNTLGRNQKMYGFTTYKGLKVQSKPNVSNYKINVIDADTNEIIFVIDKNNVDDEFEFPENVRKIRLITNTINENTNFRTKIAFTKEVNSLDIVNQVSLNDFLALNSISNGAYVYQTDKDPDLGIPFNGNASFSETYSSATLLSEVTSYTREIEETSIPLNLVIRHNSVDTASKRWKEGYYLLELPKEIIDVENLEIIPKANVISSEVLTINNKKFIKIIAKNSDIVGNADIKVNFNAVIDPKEKEFSETIRLYALNPTNTLYNNPTKDIYDINGNGNVEEKVSLSGLQIRIAAPKEVLTGAIITDYDSLGSKTVSPLIADVNPVEDDSDANVNVFIINNSTFKIRNINLVGKVAYEGNTYEGINGNLGSQYDIKMAGPIQIPEALNGKVKVYYSTKETPTKDINDTNNGWTENVTDYSNIKTYLIKFDDDVTMKVAESYDFYYPIEMPNTTSNLLKVTYFNHGIYFNRITDAGTFEGKVTSPKLGVRLARKYDLNLTLFKPYSIKIVPGGQYVLTDEDGNTQSLSVDSNGNAIAKNLYVGKEYKIKQYSATNNFIKDEEEKTFKVVNNNDDTLSIEKDGKFKRIEYGDNNVLNIDLENEMLYTLDLHNIDSDSNASIRNTIFKVTGVNHESGDNIITDNNGHAYLKNMVLGEIYKIDQVRIANYAKVDSFNIKLERDLNTHEVKILVEESPKFKLGNCDSIFNRIEETSFGSDPKMKVSGGTYRCNIEIDLTNYRDKYHITGNAYLMDYFDSSNNPYVRLSLLKNEQGITRNPFIEVRKAYTANGWYSNSKNFDVYKAYEKENNTYKEVDIAGGDKYYISVEYLHGRYYIDGGYANTGPWTKIQSLKALPINSSIEFIFQDELSDVNPKNNLNVSQTLLNSRLTDTDNPILKVDVKNKYIKKVKIKFNKLDGETNEALSGAQYKITGPGLPGGSKYFTVDSEGKASLELYMSYSGSYSYVPGMNNNYPVENYYKLEEVTPPKGYSKEDKPIVFKLDGYVNYTNGNLSYAYNTKYNLTESNAKFASVEIDEETLEWDVALKDYPIVKITKKDEETDELLPNTFYAVYKVSRANGVETIDFATDDEGKYIGEKLTIDGKDYYVVKTNEKGTLSLNLSSGQYQLKEIQAADDKYEISDQITYFGVGETVPYQSAGLSLVDGFVLDNLTLPTNERTSRIYKTNDGGFLITVIGSNDSYGGPLNLIKLDSEKNMLWNKSLSFAYKQKVYYEYFDDPERVVDAGYYRYNNNTYSAEHVSFKEVEDGYYFLGPYNDIYKLNKETGEVILHNGVENESKSITTYTGYCDKGTGGSYNDYTLNPNVEDKYYCTSDYIDYNSWSNYDYKQHGDFTDNGEAIILSKQYGEGNYGIMLEDGTRFKITGGGYQYFLLKYNNKGKLLEANNINEKIRNAEIKFLEDNFEEGEFQTILENDAKRYNATATDLTYEIPPLEIDSNYLNNFKVLPNGDIVLIANISFIKSNYTYTDSSGRTNTASRNITAAVLIRFDKNYNVKLFTTLGVNGERADIYSNANYVDEQVKVNDDGSFMYFERNTTVKGVDLKIDNYDINRRIYMTENNIFEFPKEEGYSLGYYTNNIYSWDKNGKPVETVEIARSSQDNNKYDISNDFKRVYNFNSAFTIIPVEDGYIVGNQIQYKGNYYPHNIDVYYTVELASGETIQIDNKTSYIIYKVNKDSSIEWLKQYGNLNTNKYGVEFKDLFDNKFYLYKVGSNYSYVNSCLEPNGEELITSVNDLEHYKINADDKNASLYSYFLEFELKDEVKPEAPSATNIVLKNKRKEYKVNITNNEGGTFDITDQEDNIIYQGNNPQEVETIKHGDNSLNVIKIIPNRGYGVKNITVNGNKAAYNVDEDGNIILHQFDNVTENKNINVTFELGNSRVVVHHYLKDTNTKIASDELLTGKIGEDYVTEARGNSLYTLAKDSNGDYIVPENYKGKYTVEPKEVIYYYDYNMVKLKINFYKNNTDIKVADSIEEAYVLGSKYITKALDIEHYKVVGVLGQETGNLMNDLTEVTYFYDGTETGKIEVNYIDMDTGDKVAPTATKIIPINTRYETDKLEIDPFGYEYSHSEGDVVGTISEADEKVVVTYFYKRIKSNITTRYLDPETKKDITEKDIQVVNIGDRYETHELDNIPKGYKLKEVPDNASGIADKKDIEVVYYYEKIKEVKEEQEIPDVPNTLDNSFKYVILGFTSIIGLIISYKIKKKVN